MNILSQKPAPLILREVKISFTSLLYLIQHMHTYTHMYAHTHTHSLPQNPFWLWSSEWLPNIQEFNEVSFIKFSTKCQYEGAPSSFFFPSISQLPHDRENFCICDFSGFYFSKRVLKNPSLAKIHVSDLQSRRSSINTKQRYSLIDKQTYCGATIHCKERNRLLN